MERQMDMAYARLSLRFAFLCANADNYLEKPCFTVMARMSAWEFTEQLLDQVRVQAIQLGIPVGALDLTPEQESMVADDFYLNRLIQLQMDADAKRPDPKARPF